MQVLKLLPLDFPLSVMKQFFIRSLRSTIDTSRTSRIQHNLAKGENLQVSGLRVSSVFKCNVPWSVSNPVYSCPIVLLFCASNTLVYCMCNLYTVKLSRKNMSAKSLKCSNRLFRLVNIFIKVLINYSLIESHFLNCFFIVLLLYSDQHWRSTATCTFNDWINDVVCRCGMSYYNFNLFLGQICLIQWTKGTYWYEWTHVSHKIWLHLTGFRIAQWELHN